jgi:hypothetical protein
VGGAFDKVKVANAYAICCVIWNVVDLCCGIS